MSEVYRIRWTPKHPDGYPRFFKDTRQLLIGPFFLRLSVGAPEWKTTDRGAAEAMFAWAEKAMADPYIKGTIYELRPEIYATEG